MKKALSALAAGALMSIAGLASAAEPMQLTDSQMDSVAAGNYSRGGRSGAETGGSAVYGTVVSGAVSGTASTHSGKYTFAGAATIADGFLVHAGASAGSRF